MREYGLMPPKDAETMERVLEMVSKQFPDGEIRTLEIGVHWGVTSRAIRDFFIEKKRKHTHTGIDNQRDMKMEAPFPECKFIIGSSITSYFQVKEKQHFIFIDGNHSRPYTVADFFCYKDLVEDGGFIAFHDCGKQIKLFTDFQGVGDMDDPDMYIACRKAVKEIGLLDNTYSGWKLIIDEFDENFHTGGIVVVQKTDNSALYHNYMALP